MNPRIRVTQAAAWCLVSTALLLVPGASTAAATLSWTGSGGSALWSDAANWNPAQAPVDGDDLLFGGASPRANSFLDLSRTFGSLGFLSDAQAFSLHVQGSGASLSFSGAGIRNLTAGSGPIRQDFFADAGTLGGSIVFTGHAGINLGVVGNFRPVNLTALGGSTATAIGGRIVLQDDAATSDSTFDALRAEGASAVGATGGDITLRDRAIATKSASVVITGGKVQSALGARASFTDLARLDGTLNVLAGENRGLGARAAFSGSSTASASASIFNQGARTSAAGAEAVTSFHNDATMVGSATNEAGQGAGFNGGRLEFHDHSTHDSTGIDPSLGIVQVINGGTVAGTGSGRTVFLDDSAVRGTQLLITNAVQSEGAEAGSAGGTTEFRDRSRAGRVTIVNEGATVDGAGTTGGSTAFLNRASADSADITSNGGSAAHALGGNLRFSDDATAGAAALHNGSGRVANAQGGTTQFRDRSTAGSARIGNQGGSVAGAFGGTVDFSGSTSAGSATIVNSAGEVIGTVGGSTRFSGRAGAGTAFIANNTALSLGGGVGGTTVFSADASAQRATLDNQGGFFTSDNASTSFRDRALAGQARITNFGGRAAGAFGGVTSFTGTASADAATLVMAGGGVARALGGIAVFTADSTAGTATFFVRSATTLGASGGRVFLSDRSSAGSARFTVEGSNVDSVLGPEGAAVTFRNTASASNASFEVGGNLYAGGGSGRVAFNNTSTAANATIALAAGKTRGGALTFEGSDAANLASADAAQITNRGSSIPAARGLAIGGATTFVADSTAARATITNEAGYGAGSTNFFTASRAGSATIFNLGGGAGADGGTTQFSNSSTAERAVIVNRAGDRGSNGFDAAGATRFVNQSSAGEARITADGATSASAVGGLISFQDIANPANATLVAEGGANGGSGGRIRFGDLTNASAVRVILNAGVGAGGGGSFDISGLSSAVGGVGIGSIEGGGTVHLGGKNLTVFSGAVGRTFSGVIRDGGVAGGTGGSLSVTGGVTLTLTGASTYSGGTRIGDGVNNDSGKLIVANVSGSATGSGTVEVRRGGTLSGGGAIGGAVLRSGGTIAPGDPVTLTVQDSLTWDGGGVIRLVVGADSAGSDHLNVGTLIRGADGLFLIDLIDFGVVAGQTYDLIRYDDIVGFDVDDFSFSGVAGTLALQNGVLDFTASVAAVPEPATSALMLLGLLVVSLGVQRRRA